MTVHYLPRKPDRYIVMAFSDGYLIVDTHRNGFIASRVHGPNSDLAGKILKALNEGEVSQAVRFGLTAAIANLNPGATNGF